MRVRAKCSCGWNSSSEISSVGLITHCPVCGKCVSMAPEPLAEADPEVVWRTKPGEMAPARSCGMDEAGDKKATPAGKTAKTAERPCVLAIAARFAGLISLITLILGNLITLTLGNFQIVRRLIGPAFPISTIVLGTVGVIIGTIALLKKMPGRIHAKSGVAIGGMTVIGTMAVLAFVFPSGNPWMVLGGPAPPPPAAIGPTSRGPSAAASQPSVLGGQEITDVLTAPLSFDRDAEKARTCLNLAIRLYTTRHEKPWKLASCVRYFREHLARAGLDAPANAEHAQMFRTARDELVDRVLLDYRRAGQLEQAGKWKEAKEAYGEIRGYLLDGPIYENARDHRRWCLRKEIESDKKGAH